MSKVFVDTHVLVYAFDQADSIKMKTARQCLYTLEKNGNGVISTQVLQEFYVALVQKLKVDPLSTKAVLHSFRHFETIQITSDLIEEAVDCSVLKKYSFWDSLIVVCAEQARCQTLWTEDFQHGQVVRGVKIVNPFI
ncbi:MAG: PIN domain-containing protein [Fibrobacterota bacterium]